MTWPTNCIRQNELLANHTSFRIGGPVDWFAEPSSLDDLIGVLREAHRTGLPVSVVGGGTNTLAADRGIHGVVVHLGRGFRTVQEESHAEESSVAVRCGAALLTQRLVALAAQHGWGGVETLAGLPGWVGGAVVMNAQNIGQFVERLRMIAFDGTVRELKREQLQFNYRYAAIEPGIITDVVLRFPRVPIQEAYDNIRKTLQHRNTTQEVRLPSAGCAFKNPPGVGAGRLIDQAGLKGARIGDAQISHRHANFIVNLGYASCDNVLSLMEHVQQHVHHRFGVLLEPEVRLVGERYR